MNYASHSLRTNLQEWKNRLYRATYQQFAHQLKYLFTNFKSDKQLAGLLAEATRQFTLTKEEMEENFQQMEGHAEFSFSSEVEQAAFCYQMLNHFFQENQTYNIQNYTEFASSTFEETRKSFVEEFIAPIVYYLHDRLDKSNAVLYLLEKYKRRTEWFTRKSLYAAYKSATKSYEQLLEDDLRLFLFDQGIEYPFSTPASSSGRADIVGEIETDDPLIVEIKIVDREKGYGKNRIKEGFTQVVKYANDYGKQVGYLVLFNMDESEINFRAVDDTKVFPPAIHLGGKTFYFVVVNCFIGESASKVGVLKELSVQLAELTANVEAVG